MNNNKTIPIIRRRIRKSQRRRDGLIRFANDTTSQNGEDGIIRHVFEVLLGEETPSQRFCVDVGAWDGRHWSNTYALLVPSQIDRDRMKDEVSGLPSTKSKWKGVLIEADPNKFRELQILHEPLGNVCLHAIVSGTSNSESSLVSLLQNRRTHDNLPINFDFLCIDVDGSDYWLLHDIFHNSHFRPKLICIEFNPTMPDDLIYIPANDESRHGCSLAALVELSLAFQYSLVETTLYNAFFVPQAIYERYFQDLVPDTSIEALHEITMGTSLYQLYDGTLKLWGCKKLLWHRISLDEEKLQILPSSDRRFPFAPEYPSRASFDISDPIVDISSYCQSLKLSETHNISPGELSRRMKCSVELLKVIQKDGFVLVRGTGMCAELCRNALRMTHKFLHEADEAVRRSCLSMTDRARRGYSPINTENFASLLGEHGPNDLVRKFRIGPEPRKEDSVTVGSLSAASLTQSNVWPGPSEHWEVGTCEDFKTIIESYYDKICKAANVIVDCICDGLIHKYPDLKSSLDFFSLSTPSQEQHPARLVQKTSILTMLGYQYGSRHKKKHHRKKRAVYPLVAAHTDVGVITVLLFDGGDCAVLQRKAWQKADNITSQNEMEAFRDVILPNIPENDPVFVVQIGDCLSTLSHDRLPSTIHRVMPKEGRVPRNCLALFVGMDPKQPLNMADGTVTTYEAWRKNRISESQAVLRNGLASSRRERQNELYH